MFFTGKLFLLTGFTFLLFLVSCSSPPAPVTVYHDVYSEDSPTTYILIDDSIPVGFTDSSLVAIKLPLGSHFIKTKAGHKSFLVTEKGGLLNVDDAEYVVFPITYHRLDKSGESLTGGELLWPTAVAVDSFVIIQNYIESLEDSTILKMIAGKEGGEGFEVKDRLEHSMLTWYKRMKKIGKGEAFIPKTWDYDMTDSIPEMISTYDQSPETAKFMLLPEKFFLDYASQNKDVYTILNLKDIKSGLRSKRIERDSLQKQQLKELKSIK